MPHKTITLPMISFSSSVSFNISAAKMPATTVWLNRVIDMVVDSKRCIAWLIVIHPVSWHIKPMPAKLPQVLRLKPNS